VRPPDELKQIAESANHGGREWYWRGGYPQAIFREGDAVLVAECFENPDFPSRMAEFIATFDPPTVLKLLLEADLR
jgi:chromosome condensin MukBEF complex kleisin-like MukF subunit